MTLQELASLPIGTRVKYDNWIDNEPEEGERFDYGSIIFSGVTVLIAWATGESMSTCVDTKKKVWEKFALDISLT
jgi:hypothetical protein